MSSERSKIQFNHRLGPEGSDEPGPGLVPLGGRQNRDVDVAAQCAGRTVGSATDLADVSGADDHQIDILREWAGFAVVTARPGSVDQPALDAAQTAKPFFQDGLRTDCLEQDRVELLSRPDIEQAARMTDVLIRDVPDDVLAGVDARASKLGLSRVEYIRRRLAADAATTTKPVSVAQLRSFAAKVADLADPAVMDAAWR